MKTVNVCHMEIGGGIPRIVVPVMASSRDELLVKAEMLKDSPADMIEIRADAWQGSLKEETEALSELKRTEDFKDVPFLITWRSEKEGGKGYTGDEHYEKILMKFLEAGCADLMDVEFDQPARERLIEECRRHQVPVVCSWHDFRNTPPANAIWNRLRAMADCGADIVKCAIMPSCDMDAVRILALGARVRQELDIPACVIAMGERGRSTRTSGEIFGSAFTFACLPGEASAPGQLTVDVLRAKLNGIHERFSEGRHIFLTGFMGTGKTVTARSLAKKTGLPCIEMDDLIEDLEGRRIRDIFASDGEAYFRDTETRLISLLYKRERAVVSCGGGAVLREENRVLMKALGRVVLLTAKPETVLMRLEDEEENRPNLYGKMTLDGISSMMARREEAYYAAADLVIPTDGLTPDETADKILEDM